MWELFLPHPVETTGYTPAELLERKGRPNIFRNLLKKKPDQIPTKDTIAEKVLKAYARAKISSFSFVY
jgi:hypothetical protein